MFGPLSGDNSAAAHEDQTRETHTENGDNAGFRRARMDEETLPPAVSGRWQAGEARDLRVDLLLCDERAPAKALDPATAIARFGPAA
jgi:hypothetical protein